MCNETSVSITKKQLMSLTLFIRNKLYIVQAHLDAEPEAIDRILIVRALSYLPDAFDDFSLVHLFDS